MVYIILVAILFWGAYYYDYRQKKSPNKGYLYFELICLVIVSTFRYKVGADTLLYMEQFDTIDGIDELKNYNVLTSECGFLWYVFLAICQYLGSFYWEQFLHAVFVNVAIFYFFKKHSSYYYTCVFFYGIVLFTYFNFEIMRASLGIGIWLLYGYDYLTEKRFVKYTLVAIIACLFHIQMAFLFLLPFMYALRNVKISIKTLALLILVSIAAELAFSVTGGITEFFSYSDYSTHKITMYAEAINENLTFAGVVMYFISFFPYFVALFLCKNCTDFASKNERMLIIIMIVISFVGIKYSVLVGRLVDILYPVFILHLAKGLYLSRYSFVLLKSITMFFVILNVCIYYTNGRKGYENWRRYLPYTNIIDKEGASSRESMLDVIRYKR